MLQTAMAFQQEVLQLKSPPKSVLFPAMGFFLQSPRRLPHPEQVLRVRGLRAQAQRDTLEMMVMEGLEQDLFSQEPLKSPIALD
jgi:hypothetical protein